MGQPKSIYNDELQKLFDTYLNDELLKNAAIDATYFLKKAQRDEKYTAGQDINYKLKHTNAGSLSYEKHVPVEDILRSAYHEGQVEKPIQVYGAMVFSADEIAVKPGVFNESKFIGIVEDDMQDFMPFFRNEISGSLFGSPHACEIDRYSESNQRDGIISVDRFERIKKGMPFKLVPAGHIGSLAENQNVFYISKTDKYYRQIQVTDVNGAKVDLSGFQKGSRIYHLGVYRSSDDIQSFVNVTEALLPEKINGVNVGGSDTLHGIVKSDYPDFMMPLLIDATNWTVENALKNIFHSLNEMDRLNVYYSDELVMHPNNYSMIVQHLEESDNSSYKIITPKDNTKEAYDWKGIHIHNATASKTIKLTSVYDVKESISFFPDWKNILIYTDKFFSKRKHPQTGATYYEIRGAKDYFYVTDIYFRAQCRYKKVFRMPTIYNLNLRKDKEVINVRPSWGDQYIIPEPKDEDGTQTKKTENTNVENNQPSEPVNINPPEDVNNESPAEEKSATRRGRK